MEENYEASGLVADVNAAFGRNRRRDVLREKAEADPESLEAEVADDELKAAMAQVRWVLGVRAACLSLPRGRRLHLPRLF